MHDPRPSSALDAAPLDSDVDRRQSIVADVHPGGAGGLAAERDPAAGPAVLLRCVA
jgi:hypothetical protein